MNDVEMHLADLIVPLLFIPFNEVNITFEDVPVVCKWLVTIFDFHLSYVCIFGYYIMLYSQLNFSCLPN
jgi:hypothetical protein